MKKQYPITKTQQHILYLLYKFRYLTTPHLQKLLNHKNPQRTQSWLKDLKDKKYINTNYNPTSYDEKKKAAVYYLTSKCRKVLEEREDCDRSFLERLSKEKSRSQKFIDHSLSIVDAYLFFSEQKEADEKVHFFTANELFQQEYFPQPIPSAYISVVKQKESTNYFLEVFDAYVPSFVIRSKVRSYISYMNSGEWEANTDSEPFPVILFVCPSRKILLHISYYAKGLFEKDYEESLQLFLTTKDKIQIPQRGNIWEQVTL